MDLKDFCLRRLKDRVNELFSGLKIMTVGLEHGGSCFREIEKLSILESKELGSGGTWL